MACMCGDYCCNSCGPAQGNSKCGLCGAWASDPCKHINQRTGEYKKVYLKQVAKMEQAENEFWNKYAKDLEEVYD
jgi:hypothetical protein